MAYENNIPDRELDWDEEISNDSGFVLLPEGDYPYTITKMERARWEGSAKVGPCRMVRLTVALHGGSLGETVWHYIRCLCWNASAGKLQSCSSALVSQSRRMKRCACNGTV